MSDIENILLTYNKKQLAKKFNITAKNKNTIDKQLFSYFQQIGFTSINQLKNLRHEQLKIIEEKYNKNPKICLICGNKISFNKRLYKTCSRKCATILGNKNKNKRTAESLLKTSLSLQKYNEHISKDLENSLYTYILNNHGNIFINDIYIDLDFCLKHEYILNIYNIKNISNKLINTKKFIKQQCSICNKIFFGFITKNGNIKSLKATCSIECEHKLRSIKSKINIDKQIEKNTFIGWKLKCSSYKQCWHTTWNNKKYFLRSSFELDFAKELDEKHINYEVETIKIKYFDSIQNKVRTAISDFYLPETNTIIEIKSLYTLNKRNLYDRYKEFKKLGFNFELVLNHQKIKDIESFLLE